ncbi:hypothetical protein NEOLEDRAFT_1176016 [Neolentinus lepideus HHB14362 ss-1]|uniref:Velvet domain-containing protein n=1 Tax=Neolentinus lepideus HHB14362 ss-1 TaxID=1314782 RepID=A0A165UJS4_9AGAM|nr:hypothetical protein NEOLEDRAFT_1176016 [Neolentinus lepideus HHB14362 ss-1]
MQPNLVRACRPRSSSIGQPVEFIAGRFVGQTMRAELQELQKADLGRKYARKDRRPLDPPPIVQVRLFRVYNLDTDREVEEEIENYEEVQTFGLLCHIDLFQVPTLEEPEGDEDTPVPDSRSDRTKKKKPIAKQGSYQVPVPARPHAPYQARGVPSSSNLNIPTTSFMPIPFAGPTEYYPDSDPEQQSRSSSSSSSYAGSSRDVIAFLGDHPIRESSKCTTAVAGATFVQCNEVTYADKKALMFVFSDLAVRREGTFVLRYRFLDIFSRARGCTDLSVLAECFGGPFRVYSTKEFPGLSASTPLTKQISFSGVRTNMRETERKRRTKSEILAAQKAEQEARAREQVPTQGVEMGKGKGKSRLHRYRSYDSSSGGELRHALDEDSA